MIDCLKPVVQVLHTVSGILNEAAAFVSPAILLILFGTHFLRFWLQVPFQPTKAILVGIDVLLAVLAVLHLSLVTGCYSRLLSE